MENLLEHISLNSRKDEKDRRIDGKRLQVCNRWDIFFYVIIMIFCFISFQHTDILHTGGASFAYLNGHFSDFYEATQQVPWSNNIPTTYVGGSNYLPSTYIVFAIWNIPIWLLKLVTVPTQDVGFIFFWYKLLTTLFFASSAIMMFKIGIKIGLSNTYAKLLAIYWVASPILFFSQFIYAQYDIFMMFFVLSGLYFYLQKRIG